MKRIIVTMLVLFLGGLAAGAQSAREDLEMAMKAVFESVGTLQSDFVQTKTVSMLSDKAVMTGSMHYSAPDCVRWEYLAPYRRTMVMSGTSVAVKDGDDETAKDVSGSQMYRRISKLMMNVSAEDLSGGGEFSVVVQENDRAWTAILTPCRKEMRRSFSEIVLMVMKKTGLVDSIEMKEDGGSTLIEFRNIKTGMEISPETFTIADET